MKATPEADSWILFPRRGQQPRLRLFCFPYAGRGAAVYRLWPDRMPPPVEVCRIQPPGRENRLRERPFTRLPALVQALVPILRPHLDLPFAFFGHSMGALVGFELARALRAAHGLGPAHLFASGYRAPQAPLDAPIHQLPDREFIEMLRRRYDGIPEEILEHPDVMELMLPMVRADVELCDTYSYADARPLDCPISAFGGLQDFWVSPDHLRAWRRHTTRSFSLQLFPGNHFFLENAPAALLETVAGELERLLE